MQVQLQRTGMKVPVVTLLPTSVEVLEEYPLPVSSWACVAKGSTRRESRKKPMEEGFEGAMLACERRTGLQANRDPAQGPAKGRMETRSGAVTTPQLN